MSKQQIVNLLTLIIVLAWLGTSIARIWVAVPQSAILDAVVPLTIGYWFTVHNGEKKATPI